MFDPQALGVLFGIGSAVVWGCGDFLGGLASRRAGQIQIVALAAAAGFVILLPAALVRPEPPLSAADAAWAGFAGLTGAVGIAALYAGLAAGRAAVVAPTAGVVSALLPLILSLSRGGAPDSSSLAGFLAGLGGIWLVSRPHADEGDSVKASGLRLGLLAGLGFAAYFVLIAQVQAGRVLVPLLISKVTALVFAGALLWRRRQPFPRPSRHPIGVVTGIFDAGGNLFYMLAVQHTSLAVAAVLASMYPAATVSLSALVIREKVSRPQVAGIGLCLLSVGLMAT